MGILQCVYPLLSVACVVSQPFLVNAPPFCLCSCLSECTRVIAPLYNSLCIYIRISSQGVGGWEPLLLCLENCPPTPPCSCRRFVAAPVVTCWSLPTSCQELSGDVGSSLATQIGRFDVENLVRIRNFAMIF